MKKNVCILILLLTLCLFAAGCVSDVSNDPSALPSPIVSAEPTASPIPTAEPTATPEPTPEPTPAATPEPTPEPTPAPAPTPEPTPDPTPEPTPEPTPTPVPNPYVGIWTIEELPFSLELRDDGTYLASVIHQDKEGTYSFDDKGVVLHPTQTRSLELRYFSKADTLKFGEFKLIRDDLVFFQEMDGVPVTFIGENEELEVSVRGAVAEIIAKNGKTIGAYCFTAEGTTPPEDSADWFVVSETDGPTTSVRVFKYDGRYTLWVRDAEGSPYQPISVAVDSGFLYPIGGEGVRSLIDPLKSVLKGEKISIDEFNRRISKNVAAAGYYTRVGVVTAGVSLISELAKYGYSVPHQVNGSYDRARNWGVDPNWGERRNGNEITPKLYCAGMHDAATIVWAYKQAGMNIASELETRIGVLGERNHSKDNKIEFNRAESGDIIKYDSHYQMVIDRLDTDRDGEDDAYLTYEICDSQLTVNITTFQQAKKREVFSMDAVFDGSGRNAKKLYYWQTAFRIPTDAMPQYVLESMEAEEFDQSYRTLMKELGFHE